MTWNRNQAAQVPQGEERARFEATLPERGSAPPEGEPRAGAQQARRTGECPGEDASRAQMVGEAQVRVEQEVSRRKTAGPEPQTSPRAGRTGGLGSRAEKPSEGTQRQIGRKQPQPSRSSKSPNAAALQVEGSDKPRAQKSGRQDDDLPLPMRDSTA